MSKTELIESDGFIYLENYQDTNFNQIDIFSPCATGGDLNQEFLNFSENVKVDCVLGAANNQLADNDIELFSKGLISRDYLLLNDVINLLVSISEKQFSKELHIFNLGSGEDIQILQIAKKGGPS